MPNVVVKKSAIQGKGVFAGRNFKRGEVVLPGNFTILTKKEKENLPEKEKKFVSRIKNKFVLFRIPDRCVNHSCEPNTKLIGFESVAKRDIPKGEEITTDYLKEGVKLEFNCNCPKHQK